MEDMATRRDGCKYRHPLAAWPWHPAVRKSMRIQNIILASVLTLLLTASAFAEDQWLRREAQLRAEPSAAGTPVAALAKGDRVAVVESSGAWVKVDFKGTSGWIAADSLSK